jgi:carbonic anhydrase
MSATETMLERNAIRSSELGARRFSISPDLRALVLTCADHRVDPAHVLGLELGEAVIVRNAGGRVTPAFIQSLAVLAVVAAVEGLAPGFELIVMQHTDCGLSRLDRADYTTMVAQYFGIEEAQVGAKHLSDPHEAVRTDLHALCAHPLIPPTLIASGVVYDIASGRAELVAAPAPLGSAAVVPE